MSVTPPDGNAITVVSWNVKGAQGSANQDRVMAKLHALGADVALLQEAWPESLPSGWIGRPAGTAGRDGKRRPWTAAVVPLTDNVTLSPVTDAEGTWNGRALGTAPLECVSLGRAAVAQAETPVGALTLVSMYGLMEFGYASGNVLRTIADLEPVLDSAALPSDLLLAGDWNIGTWWHGRDQKYARREGAVLSLLAAYGLVDLLDTHLDQDRGRLAGCPCLLDSCRHVWTYRKDSRNVAYQDDYAFCTAALASRVSKASVDPDWDWASAVSDHAPLVIVISSESGSTRAM